MQKLLLQVDSDPIPSTFDTIAAYDAGVDTVIPYGGIRPETVADIATGAIFTRGGETLKNTAIFVGGSNVALGEQLLAAIQKHFFGPFRVSLLLDSNGCNTTAAAAVARIAAALPLAGKRVVVTGTGPVGTRVAGLMAREGALVTLTTIRADWLDQGIGQVQQSFGVNVEGRVLPNQEPAAWRDLLSSAAVLFGATKAGVQVVPRAAWEGASALQVIADVNLVPPAGIEGVEMADNLVERNGKRLLGPIGIGNFKMKVHRAAVQALFESNNQVLDAQAVYSIARTLL